MTKRSRAREVALQLLFQRDANTAVPRPAIEEFARGRLREEDSIAFCLSLYDGVVKNLADIDSKLAAAAENWRLPRMANVDRNVLRLGAFELLFPTDDAPAPVALDEAIELARRYGSKDSTAFVNGVLDKINKTQNPTASPDDQSEIPNPKSEIA
jgi:transcription antitermination protein NusB